VRSQMLNDTIRNEPTEKRKSITDICPNSRTVRDGDSVYLHAGYQREACDARRAHARARE